MSLSGNRKGNNRAKETQESKKYRVDWTDKQGKRETRRGRRHEYRERKKHSEDLG